MVKKAKKFKIQTKNSLLNQSLDIVSDESDIEVTQEDFEYFKNLNNQKPGLDGEEEDYEIQHKKRQKFNLNEEKQSLLLKTADGHWIENPRKIIARDEKSDDSDIEDALIEDALDQQTSGQNNQQDEQSVGNNKTFEEKRVEIGVLAAQIMEDSQQNIGKLRQLRQFANDKDQRIVKICLLSLCAIFQDIIPGYKIRELSEKEKQVKVSKEVRLVRDYEESLVKNYQAYIQLLDEIATKHSTLKSDQIQNYTVLVTAMKCLCQMAPRLWHFNFRVDLLQAIVKRMNLQFHDSEKASQYGYTSDHIQLICCTAISEVIKNDNLGEISMEIVRLMSSLVKHKGPKIRPIVLMPLLDLNISFDMNQAQNKNKKDGKVNNKKQDKKHMSKKAKKIEQIKKELDLELREAEASVSQEERQKYQAEILKHLFSIYFRILKFNEREHLLSPVMKGIAKFGHLINVDYFSELISFMRSILKEGTLNPIDSLNCVSTGFKLISGHSQALMIELGDFYEYSYKNLGLLMQLIADEKNAREIEIQSVQSVQDVIDNMFIKQRNQDITASRSSAFIKRIGQFALIIKNQESLMKLLSIVERLLIKSPQKVWDQFLADEEDVIGQGVYDPETDNLEQSNALSSKMWEFSTFIHHYNPEVRKWIQRVNQMLKERQQI